MGQKSLSRLNRINVSMFWESGVIDNNYHWVGTKVFICYNIFFKYLFIFVIHVFSF